MTEVRHRSITTLAAFLVLFAFSFVGGVRLQQTIDDVRHESIARCQQTNHLRVELGAGMERLIRQARDPRSVALALRPLLEATTPIDCRNPDRPVEGTVPPLPPTRAP